MIDSGAEFSILDVGLCSPRWKTEISLKARALGRTFSMRHLCKFPLFKEFRVENYYCEFLECELNNGYDGLIGNNILRDLNSIIDYSHRQLITANTTLPLFMSKDEEIYHNISYKEHFIEIGNNEIVKENFLSYVKADHLSDFEWTKLKPILLKYKGIFFKSGQNLSFTNDIKHRIKTRHDMPIYSKMYRYPEVHRGEVNRQIGEMLKDGIIRESNSPYNSPIWIVPKKLGRDNQQQWRIVIDYRKLNDMTIEDRFPMPNIEDIFDKLGNCQYFSTIDLAKGFHQVEMDPDDIHKTAFSTANGHYEFLRMPFGLRNAPATFQRLINNILREFIGKICLVYLDDILVFSTSIEEHMESLSKVLKCLENANLKIQPDKCLFLSRETEFLGHIITPGGIKTNPKKIEAIDAIRLPTTQKQIKSFLGITGYYRRFIKDYSKVAYHLIKYLKKNARLNTRDPEYVKAFQKLKILLKNDPILIHPDFHKHFTLTTDASNFSLGAVLTQENRPIAYASRSLNGHEQRYSTIEKELLGMVWATKHFRPYLYGRKFTIRTDHRPLVWLNNMKEPNSKLQRWKIKLNEFDFQVEYIKGKENVVADGLSRITHEGMGNAKIEEGSTGTDILINLNEIFNPEDNMENDIETVHSAETDNTYFISITEKPLNLFKNQVIFNYGPKEFTKLKIVHRKKIRKSVTVTRGTDLGKTLLECLPERGLVVIFCEDDSLFLKIQDIYRKYFANNGNLKILRSKILLEDVTNREVILRKIETEHLKNNHRGINEVFTNLKKVCFYPNLQKEIQKFVNNCEICNLAKFDRSPIKHALNVTNTPNKQNDIVHIDLWYPQRNIIYLTSIDKLTKYATVEKLKDRTWLSLINGLKKRIQYLGKPRMIIMDNEFDTLNVKQFLTDNEINFHLTTTYLKTGNADVERLHSTLNEHIRLLNADPNNESDLHGNVFKAITAYNQTLHSTTRHKPIDFINNLISADDLEIFATGQHEAKEKRIEQLNQGRNQSGDFGNVFVDNNRVSKSRPKYKKIENFSIQGNYITSNNDKFKRLYKTQVKRRQKYQN